MELQFHLSLQFYILRRKKCPKQFSPHHTLVIILFSDYVSFSLSALWYITQGPFILILSLSVSLCVFAKCQLSLLGR